MERNEAVIELAIASEETKGPGGQAFDDQHGLSVFGVIED